MIFEWHGKAYGTNKRLETTRYGWIYKNPGYTSFQDGLIWTMIRHRGTSKPIESKICVDIVFTISRKRDIDSLIKPVLDCLEKARVIRNDNQVAVLHVEKQDKFRRSDEDEIKITVKEML